MTERNETPSFDTRFAELGKEAFEKAKSKLQTLPDNTLALDEPVNLVIDDCNGYTWGLSAKTIILVGDTIHVFSDKLSEKEITEGDWSDLMPDEYWCSQGEWYAEWEGLFELIDKIIEK